MAINIKNELPNALKLLKLSKNPLKDEDLNQEQFYYS